jgi:hypothetical protein
MTERHNARRHRMSTRERRMLAAPYLPVIAFGAVLITARIWSMLPHQQAALR